MHRQDCRAITRAVGDCRGHALRFAAQKARFGAGTGLRQPRLEAATAPGCCFDAQWRSAVLRSAARTRERTPVRIDQSGGLEPPQDRAHLRGHIAPLRDGRPVDRSAHLCGTRGPARPSERWKSSTPVLPGQAALFQQAARFAGGVRDESLIADVADHAGQDVVPVVHGPPVSDVEFGQSRRAGTSSDTC